MKRVLIRCDGAAVPAKVDAERWDRKESISHRGDTADLNINIRAPRAAFDHIDGIAADLLRIAAYVFAADQEVSRGGVTDVYGDDWRRDFTLYVPVSNKEFWNRTDVGGATEAALAFVSDDRWCLRFVALGPSDSGLNIPLFFESEETMGNPDLVCLLSGGLDSLGSVIEQVATHGRRPALVGHSPAFHVRPRQRVLYRELRRRIPRWGFPYVSGAVSRSGTDAKETSQRTRSFLYAVLGVVVASYLQVRDVHLADNGVVSLNLPINGQVIGAQATRSTHPRFIRLFNRLLEAVFPEGPRVANPLWDKTRPEVLEIIKDAGLHELISLTSSCAHQRGRTRSQPYCGVCSQCIDRRYATVATGLEWFDPPERYEVDIFRDALPEGTKRALALSYHRFASDIAAMSDEDVITRHPIGDCIDSADPDQPTTARRLVSLVRRHAVSVVRVTAEQLQRHAEDMALQRLSSDCLLALVASQRSEDHSAVPADRLRTSGDKGLRHDDQFSWVNDGARDYYLTRPRAAVIRRLDDARKAGQPGVSWKELQGIAEAAGGNPRSMQDLMGSVGGWNQLVQQSSQGRWGLAMGDPEMTEPIPS